MNLTDFFKNIISGDTEDVSFSLENDSTSLFFLASDALLIECENNRAPDLISLQYATLQMLVEQGFAEQLGHGFEILAENGVLLDDFTREILQLPPKFIGSFDVKMSGLTENNDFSLALSISLPDGDKITSYNLEGPLLKISEDEIYLPTKEDWLLLKTVHDHSSLPVHGRTRYNNLSTISVCQQAKKLGANVDLAAFNKLKAINPQSVKLSVEELSSGDLLLNPDFSTTALPGEINNRIGQLDLSVNTPQCMNVGDDIIILDEKKLAAVKEVMASRRINASQAEDFFKSPTAFLDASLVDLDVGFSLRVKGATEFKPVYFGDTDESGISWFDTITSKLVEPQELHLIVRNWDEYDDFEESFSKGANEDAKICYFKEIEVHIEDKGAVREKLREIAQKLSTEKGAPAGKDSKPKVVIDIHTNDEELAYGSGDRDQIKQYTAHLDFTNLKYPPYNYQEKGIRWILSHALSNENDKGCLLADDMGLGKTFMSLAAIEQYYNIQIKDKETQKPVLIVCPLSLIENWQDEVNKFFISSPFDEIILLQANSDLKRFKQRGTKSERNMNSDIIDNDSDTAVLSEIKYALKVGSGFGAKRLDMPKRLVITTYETLRDYMFSLSIIDWSFVIFDEAQKIKSPNAIATRASKALKAQFKLLVSGTPVENSLKDFWCLFDVAKPGYLGTYQEFRQTYIKPIATAETPEDKAIIQIKVGRHLRENIGDLMLRRTKEEELEALPTKKILTGIDAPKSGDIFDPDLAGLMRGAQLNKYNSVLHKAQIEKDIGNRGGALSALHGLKITSLHPSLGEPLPEHPFQDLSPSDWMQCGVKLESTMGILDKVKAANEKIIIFLIDKRLQLMLKLALSKYYSLNVQVINGDAPAIATKNKLSRKGLIEEFEQVEGFNIIIMSPVAAGVGLTIVGANHVIHLERHWNPAKEAQASDRVYRIGQTKNVNIYIPIALHPEKKSFDQNLNSLLSNKIDLKDAVVTTEAVDQQEMMEGTF